jgi:hypothetical protein
MRRSLARTAARAPGAAAGALLLPPPLPLLLVLVLVLLLLVRVRPVVNVAARLAAPRAAAVGVGHGLLCAIPGLVLVVITLQ